MAVSPMNPDLLVRQIGEDDDSCNFHYDPDMWGNPEDADQPFSCPYDSVPGMSFCIFHLPPYYREQLFGTITNINNQYIKAIASKRRFTIFCTTMRAASLSTVLKAIPREQEIQLSFVNIQGKFDLSSVDISSRISIHHCDIDRITLSQSTLDRELRVMDSNFDEFYANGTTFNRRCRFSETEFGEMIVGSAVFNRSVVFHGPAPENVEIGEIIEEVGDDACVFHETASFMHTEFNRGVMFNGVTFEQSALFGHAEFAKGGSFHGMEVTTGVDFNNAYFGDHTSFDESNLGIAAFYYCQFDKSASFEGAEFGNEYTDFLLRSQNGESFRTEKVHELAVRHRDRIENDFVKWYTGQMHSFAAVFNQTTVEGEINLLDTKLVGGFRADSATFSNARVRFKSPLTTTTSLFHRSTIERGEFHLDNENCFIELRNATIGPIEVKTENESNPFDNIYFDGTNYDGFEFSDYRDYLDEIDWEIDGAHVEMEYMKPIRRETTYSKAKAGASQLGDRLAESKFSILEGRSRRSRYKKELRWDNSLRKAFKNGYHFIVNGSYDLLSKYGESPQRVFGWSIGFVIVFSLIFNYMITWDGENTVYLLESVNSNQMGYSINSFTFSVQSFTSFLVGQPSRELGTWVRLVASSESFIGAFFIALFVATVVRKIKR